MKMAFPFSDKHILVVWDGQNVEPVKNVDDDIASIRSAIATQFPGIKIHMNIYADFHNGRLALNRRQRYFANASLLDIPGRHANETPEQYTILINADRDIIHDIYDFAEDHPAPNFVFLISGDADYYLTMQDMKTFGYTTILAYRNVARAAGALRTLVHCEFDFNKIIQNCDFEGGPSPSNTLYLPAKCDIPPIVQVPRKNLVLFDMDSIQLPPNWTQTYAVAKIRGFLRKSDEVIRYFNAFNYVFFGENIPERHNRAAGVTYTKTRRGSKLELMENLMVACIKRFVIQTLAPSNIIIYSTKECLSSTISRAISSGFYVAVCSPNPLQQARLKKACDAWYSTADNWAFQ